MLRRLWKKFVNRESVTYIIFGVLTTAVDWGTYTILRWMGTDYRISTALSWAAAVVFAFVTNKLFVFRSFGMRPGLVWREFCGFVAARLATGAFTMVAMVVMVDGLRYHEFFAKLVVSAASLVLNYIFSKWIIFKKPKTNRSASGDAKGGRNAADDAKGGRNAADGE